MPDAVSFGDVWNAVKDVATLCRNSQHVAMPNYAFVAPAGKQPRDLNWDHQGDRVTQPPQLTYRWDTYASAHTDGLFSPTIVRVGVPWRFGRTMDGHGLFLHEAALFCVVDSTCVGATVDATGSFSGSPYMTNGVAQLEGNITVSIGEVGGAMHVQDLHFNVLAAGDGAGYIRQA
jgi:hypothetical protein